MTEVRTGYCPSCGSLIGIELLDVDVNIHEIEGAQEVQQ